MEPPQLSQASEKVFHYTGFSFERSRSLEYYTDRLRALKDRVQEFMGNEITGERIISVIELYTKMREFLRKIGFMRRVPTAHLAP